MKSGSIKAFLKNEASARLFIPFFIGVFLLLALSLFGGAATGGEDASEETERLSVMCSMLEGVGECKIMLTYSDGKNGGEVVSAAVIYNGGGGINTEYELKKLISSLYGIGTNRIAVISSKKQ